MYHQIWLKCRCTQFLIVITRLVPVRWKISYISRARLWWKALTLTKCSKIHKEEISMKLMWYGITTGQWVSIHENKFIHLQSLNLSISPGIFQSQRRTNQIVIAILHQTNTTNWTYVQIEHVLIRLMIIVSNVDFSSVPFVEFNTKYYRYSPLFFPDSWRINTRHHKWELICLEV